MKMLRKVLLYPLLINSQRGFRRNIDPGINRRKTALENVEGELDPEDVDFDEWESDFMDVHKSHRGHVEEVERKHERLKYQIVKQKYFKVKNPNFLTWNDKQQIKYLYSTNSKEWTFEKLSESFPALPEIIEKIVRARYSKSEHQIKHHDDVVQSNWMAFKKGEMENLPERLKEHLKFFSNRSLNFSDFNVEKKVVAVKKPNISTEFSDIITSYEKLKNKHKTAPEVVDLKKTDAQNALSILDEKETQENTRKTIHQNVTLKKFKEKIQSEIVSGKEIPIGDKLIIDSKKQVEAKHNIIKLQTEEIMTSMKYQTSSGIVRNHQRDYSHLVYPERILIPKDKLKYGYTYKLNDCYYDSDGRFLYRVPGKG